LARSSGQFPLCYPFKALRQSSSQRIAAESPFAHTLFSGYSNGNLGYLPVRHAFPEGGYEVSVSLYSPDAADIVIREALQMLRELGTP
jgi:hypothetical protein